MLQPSRLVKPCLTCLARCRRAPCQCAAEQTRPTHGPKSQAYRDPGRLKRSTDQRAAINALGLRSRRGPFATQCFSTAESSCPCHHRCLFPVFIEVARLKTSERREIVQKIHRQVKCCAHSAQAAKSSCQKDEDSLSAEDQDFKAGLFCVSVELLPSQATVCQSCKGFVAAGCSIKSGKNTHSSRKAFFNCPHFSRVSVVLTTTFLYHWKKKPKNRRVFFGGGQISPTTQKKPTFFFWGGVTSPQQIVWLQTNCFSAFLSALFVFPPFCSYVSTMTAVFFRLARKSHGSVDCVGVFFLQWLTFSLFAAASAPASQGGSHSNDLFFSTFFSFLGTSGVSRHYCVGANKLLKRYA